MVNNCCSYKDNAKMVVLYQLFQLSGASTQLVYPVHLLGNLLNQKLLRKT